VPARCEALRVSAPEVRFLFDFLSPYSYLAWTQVHATVERAGATVEPVPVLLAALLNAHGQKGPAEISPKRVYIFKDVYRRAHRLGLSLSVPPTHPFNPLLALRAASLPAPAPVRRRFIDALFAATWGGGRGVEGPAEVAAAAAAAGLDGAALVSEAETPAAKARLRQQTEEALAAGAFGVPTMLVGDELFWGFDALEHVEAYLRGEDPLAQASPNPLAQWVAISPSATRSR
jgi:2-hydroxychromene-2-carboxylate isomerase